MKGIFVYLDYEKYTTKTTTPKKRIKQIRLHKIKRFSSSRNTVKRVKKRQATN